MDDPRMDDPTICERCGGDATESEHEFGGNCETDEEREEQELEWRGGILEEFDDFQDDEDDDIRERDLENQIDSLENRISQLEARIPKQ